MAVADTRRGGPAACAGPELRQFFAGGLAALERCAAAIDALNVFPVPDADTGTNLLITLRHAVQAAQICDRTEAAVVARALATAALHGARGNSGAIFAQLCAGFATSLHDAVHIEPRTWATAWQAGAAAAWQSVASPVEGTILTVAHSTARAAAEAAAAGGDLGVVWQSMADAADATVAETPRLLPILDRARVVDAGALGLALFLRGSLHPFTGAPLPDPSTLGRPTAATRHVIGEMGFSRYCTQFTLRGAGLDRTSLHAALAGCGESVDVVTLNGGTTGLNGCVRIHIHTDRPDEAVARAATLGVVSEVTVEDMEQQRSRYAAQLDASLDIALVPVVSGAGMRRLFESLLGVAAVIDRRDGGHAADDLRATLARLPCERVLILPNDARLMDDARAAAAACGKNAVVVPTSNMPQGVAAALAFNPVDSLAQNAEAMSVAASAIETLEVRYSAGDPRRDGAAVAATSRGPIAMGDDVVDAAEAGAIAIAAASGTGANRIALITVYYGAGLSQTQADALLSRLRHHFPAADMETIDGGQPDCPLWMALDLHADSNRH